MSSPSSSTWRAASASQASWLCSDSVLNAFSAHADRDELLWWADSCGSQVWQFFLVHGDEDQSEAFQGHLEKRRRKAVVPTEGQTIDLTY